MSVVRFYSDEAVSGRALQRAAKLWPQLSVSTELCYNVELTGERPSSMPLDNRSSMVLQTVFVPNIRSVVPFRHPAVGTQSLSAEQKEVLLWLFHPPLQTAPLSETSKLTEGPGSVLVEIGPRYQNPKY